VNLPSAIQAIDERGFGRCVGLATITIPNGCWLHVDAFWRCNANVTTFSVFAEWNERAPALGPVRDGLHSLNHAFIAGDVVPNGRGGIGKGFTASRCFTAGWELDHLDDLP
jgi:hypothetical protein